MSRQKEMSSHLSSRESVLSTPEYGNQATYDRTDRVMHRVAWSKFDERSWRVQARLHGSVTSSDTKTMTVLRDELYAPVRNVDDDIV
jgi:hypothetical protein